MEDLVKIKRRIEMMPIPRKVKFRVKGLFGLLPLLFLIILGVIIMFGWESACRLVSYKFGMPAKAVVDAKKEWTTQSKYGTTMSRQYGVFIRYPSPELTYRSRVIHVPYKYYVSVIEGKEIDIYYYGKLSKYPMISGGFDYGSFYLVTAILTAYLGLLTWIIIRQFNFVVKGIPLIAEITSENKGANGNVTWNIWYSWKKRNFIRTINSKGIGDKSVLVLILPDKPDSYMVYEKFQLWDVDDCGMAV